MQVLLLPKILQEKIPEGTEKVLFFRPIFVQVSRNQVQILRNKQHNKNNIIPDQEKISFHKTA